MVSTAPDLVVFFRALLGGRLLRPDMLKQMLTVAPQSQRDGYALGIVRYVTPAGHPAWGHGGGIGGYQTDVYASPDGTTVAVLLHNALGEDRLQALRFPLAANLYDAAQR